MMVGSLLVFAVSWGEFNVSFLLNRGRPQTFPAVLYDTGFEVQWNENVR